MWNDNASQIDMLFYEPYADIVSQIAVETDDTPLTIGVFGSWGAGKSTLLNLINQKYDSKDEIICVSINAWMFENYEDAKTMDKTEAVRLGLYNTIGEEVDTVEDVYEPYLIQIGYIARTIRGRIPLPPAYKHIGVEFNG